MCRTSRFAEKQAARKAALATFIASLQPMTSRPQTCIAVLNAACGADVVDTSGRIRQEKRAYGFRVKLPLLSGAKVFGPALYNAYTIMSSQDLDHVVQFVHDKDAGAVIATFTSK